MKKDVKVIEMLSLLCEEQARKNDAVYENGGNVFIGFQATVGKYVVHCNVVNLQTYVIARDNDPESEQYPNGVIFMDGYWFGIEAEEYTELEKVISEYVLEANTDRLRAKLELLQAKQVLPSNIKIL